MKKISFLDHITHRPAHRKDPLSVAVRALAEQTSLRLFLPTIEQLRNASRENKSASFIMELQEPHLLSLDNFLHHLRDEGISLQRCKTLPPVSNALAATGAPQTVQRIINALRKNVRGEYSETFFPHAMDVDEAVEYAEAIILREPMPTKPIQSKGFSL